MTARPGSSIGGLVLGALVLDLALIQPNHPAALTWGALRLFPLELPVILLGLAALPPAGALTRTLRLALTTVLTVLALWKAADLAMFTAFNRGFDPVTDLGLIDAGLRLGSGSVGVPLVVVAVLLALALLAAFAWAIFRATGPWAALALPVPLRGAAGALSLAAALFAGAEIGRAWGAWTLPFDPPGAAFATRHGLERVALVRRSLADRAAFSAAAATDPLAGRTNLFSAAKDTDILVVFVESYGRSALSLPLYASVAGTLRAAEPGLSAAGLAVRSGWLTSPIAGGQSWLAHGTLASGLVTDSQSRYAAMLAAPRRTLFHLAHDAGYRTLAVAPAIQLAWPEGRALGFDTILDAHSLGYAGKPFNWITMPDQFTLLAYDRARPGLGQGPVFGQIVLISSHAPWTPVPSLLPWDEITDGHEFDAMATAGPPPEVLWRNEDAIRDAYRRTLDYSLAALLAWAGRHADAPPLLVVLGDHQPAPFVAMSDSRDVPVHLIGPPGIVARFDSWGFTPGLLPDPAAPALPMEAFRQRFVETLSPDDLARVRP